jgi:transcriptional regulator with XRE-family HTH domain
MGRPAKYHTLEEIREAQRKRSREYYQNNKEKFAGLGNLWLKKLKENDPDAYREYNRVKRQKYLQNLRENFPEKYAELIEKERLRQKALRDAKKAGN